LSLSRSAAKPDFRCPCCETLHPLQDTSYYRCSASDSYHEHSCLKQCVDLTSPRASPGTVLRLNGFPGHEVVNMERVKNRRQFLRNSSIAAAASVSLAGARHEVYSAEGIGGSAPA